ncbi:MAG: molecular chaperone TorD family protein [Candidatus Bathyarchaeia archaeon]|nr:molecular chaperone TorD family protein [Candidatus Bathyarchaeota archaeon]
MTNLDENAKERLIICLMGREQLYSFLGRIYEREADELVIKECVMRKELFLKCKLIEGINSDIVEGFMQLYEYFNEIDEKNLDEIMLGLAVDYANLFLGVKYFREKKGIPHPSESAYLSGSMLDKEDETAEFFLEAGFIKSPEFKEPYDHIALQLYFMAHLCRKAISFIEDGDLKNLLKNLQAQRAFLTEHLLKWVPRFANDVIENSDTTFYKAIGRITRGFMSMEKDEIDEIIKEAKKLLS